MANERLYKKAIAELFHKIHGGLAERDVVVAVELFDLLMERGETIYPDDLKPLCKKEGFDDFTSDKLAQICDVVDKYRKYKEGNVIRRWNEKMIDNLLK